MRTINFDDICTWANYHEKMVQRAAHRFMSGIKKDNVNMNDNQAGASENVW